MYRTIEKQSSKEHILNSWDLTNPFGNDSRRNFISTHRKILKKYQCNFCSCFYTFGGKGIANHQRKCLAQRGSSNCGLGITRNIIYRLQDKNQRKSLLNAII